MGIKTKVEGPAEDPEEKKRREQAQAAADNAALSNAKDTLGEETRILLRRFGGLKGSKKATPNAFGGGFGGSLFGGSGGSGAAFSFPGAPNFSSLSSIYGGIGSA